MNPAQLTVLFSQEEIRARVTELGAEILAAYPAEEPLVLICILKGAAIFAADLARAIDRDVRLDFMGISSYGVNKTSSGQVKVTKDLDSNLEGVHAVIVEDIVDTGVTLTYLMKVLQARKPASLAIAALLDKPERRVRPVEPRFIGFRIPDKFVVGYGLDFAEKYRNLPNVCVLQESS